MIAKDIPRRALVTGGATRLGRAVVLALAEHGFDVAIHYRESGEAARELEAQLLQLGRKACLLQGDLAQGSVVDTLIESASSGLGGSLGVLVNNASVFDYDDWDSADDKSWEHHMRINAQVPFCLMQEFARRHENGRQGLIVNMIDERVWSPTPHFITYTLSKSALWTLTQTMALALAPRNIRVNAIGPGPTMPSARQSEEQFVRQCRSVPLGRGASSGEIGQAVIAFLSLSSVTGQMIAPDGGQHMQWSPQIHDKAQFHE